MNQNTSEQKHYNEFTLIGFLLMCVCLSVALRHTFFYLNFDILNIIIQLLLIQTCSDQLPAKLQNPVLLHLTAEDNL